MAAFFGSAQGERGETHRLGHHGMRTVAASWHGAIETVLTKEPGGRVGYEVRQIPWRGHGSYGVLSRGIIGEGQV